MNYFWSNPIFQYLSKKKFIVAPDQIADSVYGQEIKYFQKKFQSTFGLPHHQPYHVCSLIPVIKKAPLSDTEELVISVGGSYSLASLLKLKKNTIYRQKQIKIKTPIIPKKQPLILEQFVNLLCQAFLPLIKTINQKQISFSLTWAHPQIPVARPGKLPVALAKQMGKKQILIKIKEARLDQLFVQQFQQLLLTSSSQSKFFAKKFSCTVINNDGPLALQYFRADYQKKRYRQMAIVLLGTGFNLAYETAFYLHPTTQQLIKDRRQLPIRKTCQLIVNQENQLIKNNPLTQDYVVNLEPGIQKASSKSQTIYDQVQVSIPENLENQGVGGIALFNIFKNLLNDPFFFNQKKMMAQIIAARQNFLKKNKKYDHLIQDKLLSAYEICLLSHFYKSSHQSKKIILGNLKLNKQSIDQLSFLADSIIIRCAIRIAQQLTVLSLENNFGLDQKKADALAFEGSLTSIPGFQHLIKQYWTALLKSYQQQSHLNCDFLHHPQYNASAVGAIYAKALFNGQQLVNKTYKNK